MPSGCSSEKWTTRLTLTWKEVKALQQYFGLGKWPLSQLSCWAGFSPYLHDFLSAHPLNMRLNLTQLYGSSTAVSVVCWGVCKIAMIRFQICRDLLILQQLLLRLGDPVSTALPATEHTPFELLDLGCLVPDCKLPLFPQNTGNCWN